MMNDIQETYRNLVQHIPVETFTEIKNRHAHESPDPGYSKYLDLEKYLTQSIVRARSLGLEQRSGMSILDIGTGAGYFPFVCQYLGHTVLAIDAPGIEMYDEMVRLLGVERVLHRITAFCRLPSMGRRFDAITAWQVCFNNHKRVDLWDVSEWTFFLSDLLVAHLNLEGTIYLRLNPERDGSYCSQKLAKCFEHFGASATDAMRGVVNVPSRLLQPGCA